MDAFACAAPGELKVSAGERRAVGRISPYYEGLIARLRTAAQSTGTDALALRRAVQAGQLPGDRREPNMYVARFSPPQRTPLGQRSAAGVSVVLTPELLSTVWIGRPENPMFASAVSNYVPVGVGLAMIAPPVLNEWFADVELVTDAAKARHGLVLQVTGFDYKYAYTGLAEQVTSSDLVLGVNACLNGKLLYSTAFKATYTSPFGETDYTMVVETTEGLTRTLAEAAKGVQASEGVSAYLAAPFAGPPTRRAAIGKDMTPLGPAGQAMNVEALNRNLISRAERGNAQAQFDLAAAYHQGTRGLPQDAAQARSWFSKAADQGHALAQANLGNYHRQGLGGLTPDDAAAAVWYARAAAQEIPAAQANLGMFYAAGRGGLPKDDRQAARLYSLAAEAGEPSAVYALGQFYEEGLGGLPKNAAEALRLYRFAADRGHQGARARVAALGG